MGKREKNEFIENLKSKGIHPYSISRLNAIDGCLLEAYYTYKKEDRGKQNIYGIMGSRIHDVLEGIYNDELDKSALLPALEAELKDAELIGIDFPKDYKGGTAIRDSWIGDMTDFCNNFKKMDGNFVTEELVILKVSDRRYLIGYADLIQIVDAKNKVVDVLDFKTSSQFKKEDKVHHGRQLIVYGMALQASGMTVNRLGWIMLKYIKVQFDGYARSNSKKKTNIEKIIQRSKLSKELAGQVEKMAYELGYGEIDVEIMLSKFRDENSIDVLPEEIKNQFKIEQWIEYYPFTEELQQEALEYINKQADKFEALWDKPESEWRPVEINDKQSFYCFNLCAHREVCPALQKYRLMLSLADAEDDDLF